MLNKCVTSRATLLVPDVEDSVPYHEKPKAREMIRDHLPFLRENAFSESVIITPRTNAPALEGGKMFEDDVNTMINGRTW
jgi:citrate lyase beta subunit